MANSPTLKAETRKRTGSGALKQMRREGFIPSVLYGKDSENVNIKVKTKSLDDLLAHSASESILIDLEVDGGSTQMAFLQSVEHNPLTGSLIHADFLAVNDDTKITASLPVVLKGEPVGAKQGGVTEQLIHSLVISCAPKNLPQTITAEIEHLAVGDSTTVGELKLPEGVVAHLSPKVLVAIVNESRTTKLNQAAVEDPKKKK